MTARTFLTLALLLAAGLLGPKATTRFTAAAITDHLTTHAAVLERFLPVKVTIEGTLVTVAAA